MICTIVALYLVTVDFFSGNIEKQLSNELIQWTSKETDLTLDISS